ncbi:MAG: 3'-5' exonuclease, partial [Pirellulaceae bacterium]
LKLRSAGLEVSGEGGVSLDDTSPNQAILSLLSLCDHPGNQVAHYHVAHSPLGEIAGFSPADDIDHINQVTDRLRERIQQVGYGPYLEELARELHASCSDRQSYRLHQLVDLAYDFQPLRPSRTLEFREHVRLSKIEDPSSAPIRVMTIHSAKGLEFDAVVLAQLNESIDHSANRYAIGRSSPTGPVDRVLAYFKKDLQNALPPQLKNMYQDAVTEQVHDALCVLYVAFTRARHGLHVILPYDPGRKSFPKTLSGLVETAIGAPLNPDDDVDIPSFGNPGWFRDFEPETEEDGPAGRCGTASVRLQELAPGLAVPSPGTDRRPDPVTPSSQEGDHILAAADLLEIGQEMAMSRGTVVHEWLENIHWLEDGLPGKETMELDIQRHQVDASVIDQFHQALEFPQIVRLLDPGSYQELTELECNAPLREELERDAFELHVYQEFPLSALHEGQHFHGTIDRLVLATREGKVLGADIIDYKTDRIDPDDPDRTLEARSDYYRGQLEIYARGLSVSMQIPLELINTRLAFVGAGIVTRVAPR